MIFQHTNHKKLWKHKKLMFVNHLDFINIISFAIIHKGEFKNNLICTQIPRLHTDIFMRVYRSTIPAVGS